MRLGCSDIAGVTITAWDSKDSVMKTAFLCTGCDGTQYADEDTALPEMFKETEPVLSFDGWAWIFDDTERMAELDGKYDVYNYKGKIFFRRVE